MLTDNHRQLIENNVRIASIVIQRVRREFPCLDAIDSRSIANMTLVDAAVAFDPARGFKFCTYASQAIRNALLTAMKEKSLYDSRFNSHDDARRPVRWIAVRRDSLDELHDAEEFRVQRDQAFRALRVLPSKERLLVKQFYGLKTQRLSVLAIADACGQSRRTVKKRLLAALTLLREAIAADSL